DCAPGLACNRKVCRLPCAAGDTTCNSGTYCELDQSGARGFCTALGSSLDTSAEEESGNFLISEPSVSFSNIRTEATFAVVNLGQTNRSFRLKKAYHGLYDANNATIEQVDEFRRTCDPGTAGTCPLPWLSIAVGSGAATTDDEIDFSIQGGCPAPKACADGCPADMQCGNDGLCVCQNPATCEDHALCTVQIRLSGAETRPSAASRWSGVLEVTRLHGRTQRINLDYRETSAGQWIGTMYYFSGFGDGNIDTWLQSDHSDLTLLENVGNAFVKRWAQFRRGQSGGISEDEFDAVVLSTIDGTWRWPSVMQACRDLYGIDYCYLTEAGPVQYSNDFVAKPIPTGVVELPFALNLRPVNTPANSLTGKIVSSYALQFLGDPALRLTFSAAPGTCAAGTAAATCISPIVDLGLPSVAPFAAPRGIDVRVGGRYATSAGDGGCAQRPGIGFALNATPWLVPGFVPPGFLYNDESERLAAPGYAYECRDQLLPYFRTPTVPDDLARINLSLAASNPIPDGRPRRRSIELVDGFMLDNEQIYLLVRESFGVQTGPAEEHQYAGYALITLKRNAVTLDAVDANLNSIADVFEGNDYSAETRSFPADNLLSPSCSPNILRQIIGAQPLTASNASNVALTILRGTIPGAGATVIHPRSEDLNGNGALDPGEDANGNGVLNVNLYAGNYEVHWFCEDNGLIDGGVESANSASLPAEADDSCPDYAANGLCEDGGPLAVSDVCPFATDLTDCGPRRLGDLRVPCPWESRVVYFVVDRTRYSQSDIAALPCQDPDDGDSCWPVIKQWEATGTATLDPVWRCRDSNLAYCNGSRTELRDGKVFYLPAPTSGAKFLPLLSEIEQAFRYKTRFVSRGGTALGFAPDLCDPESDQVPYCYDPAGIERIAQRIDCLLDIHRNYYGSAQVPQATKDAIVAFLRQSFAYDGATARDGYERLFAELMITLGDEHFTAAFASRFDLAGTQLHDFEGSAFEVGGINLSGGAGHEMYSLYLASQYYQLVLDRFYALSPAIWASIAAAVPGSSFVTQATVVSYLTKVARASTQKARAASEIAARYQMFNRAELARRVVERVYTATYLESLLLSRLISEITTRLAPDDVPQVAATLEDIQRRYRVALADMRTAYSKLTDEITYFGFPPDYIPFPALDVDPGSNAFALLYASAQQKVALAAEREQTALEQNRTFATDSETFQQELANLRTNYERQLGDLCGTFVGSDGSVHPAIPLYAAQNPRASIFGDPCGLLGNGGLNDALVQVELAGIDLEKALEAERAGNDRIELEMNRVAAQCDEIRETVDFEYQQAGAKIALNTLIKTTEKTMEEVAFIYEFTRDVLTYSACIAGTATDCPVKGMSINGILNLGVGRIIGEGIARAALISMEEGIAGIDRRTAQFTGLQQCDLAQIESTAKVMDMVIGLRTAELDIKRAQYQLQLALSDLQRLRNQELALLGEWEEAQQLMINVQAARNDPNVRIYRNDAVINADIAFKDALAEVYRATKVYEYYTSTSYADLEKLFLVRMVRAGDYSLENYLIQLGNDFGAFEESYGRPDTRVAILSLRDDILAIPRLGEGDRPLTESARIQGFRERLTDGSLLDKDGYLVGEFATSFRRLSPLTRNHKILYVEAELVGVGAGDDVARLYLIQQGTSTVRTLDDSKVFYQFEPRTAVVNAFLNGDRVYAESELYRNYRLRDRPLVNSAYRLVLNLVDEFENMDVDLANLDDVRLYVYYTDFTQY
ncbi:MAG: hypothetical protein JXR83_23430, partial [Deltaproteobacteria bacterium]|nr:hypothetical protein [Deltaproteobacteria bacterium]